MVCVCVKAQLSNAKRTSAASSVNMKRWALIPHIIMHQSANLSLHWWQREGRWHDRTLEQDLSRAGSRSSRSVFTGERRASLSLWWYSQHGCWSRQLLAAVSKESPIILISPQRWRQTSHRNISRCQALLNIEGVLYRRCSGELDILVSRMLLVCLLYWHTHTDTYRQSLPLLKSQRAYEYEGLRVWIDCFSVTLLHTSMQLNLI